MRKGVLILFFGLFLAIALAGITGATVLANIKITATFYNYTSGNTYNADFHLKVIDKANDGFDNSDFVLQKIPGGGGYAVLYSNTIDGYSLTIDSYNGTSARKVKLVYAIVPTDTGVVNLTWHVSGKKFKVKLKDYAHDDTYTTAIATRDMMTTSDYSASQPFSDGFRYFGLESDTYQIPIFFVPPTPDSGTNILGNNAEIRVNMTNASALSDFVLNWNGTNYTLYDSSSLMLMMNFNNDSSLGENATFVKDLSYYENDGTVMNGATWTSSGKYGGAYSFDGVDDYIDLTNPISGIESANYTISSWMLANGVGSSNDVIFSQQDATGYHEFDTLLTATNCYFSFNTYEGGYSNVVGSTNLCDSNWHNVISVKNGTNGTIYVDGVLINSGTVKNVASTDRARIGLYPSVSSGYNFNGTIDELRIYNRTLSASEVKQLYYSSLQKYDSDKWSFYTNQQSLTGGLYTYRAFANDYYDGWNSTEKRNVTIENKILAFSLPVDTVDFGNMTLGEQKANLTGLRIQNDGNVYINIDINATKLFSSNSISYPGDNYLFRVGDAGKGNESNGTYNSSSALAWTQFDSNSKFAFYYLNYSSARNLAALQVNITVPADEAAGRKESIIVITGTEA